MTEETKKRVVGFWRGIKLWAFKYIGGLFMEDKDGHKVISIGRCMLLAVLGWMFYYWGAWVSIVTLTPEALAMAIAEQLPEGNSVSGVDLLAAAQKIVSAMPSAAPPLLSEAFTVSCLYVFGTKVHGLVDRRLNGNGGGE